MKHKLLALVLLVLAGSFTGLFAQGNAVSLDGVNDYIAMGDYSSLMGSAYTAEIWIKPAVLGGTGDIASYGRTLFASTNPGPAYGYPLWVTLFGDEIAVWAFETTAARVPSRTTSGVDIQTNTWYHIAVTAVDGGATLLYVNGVQVLSFTNDGEGSWGTQFTVGDLRPDRLIPFGGLVDEIRVWSVVRTAGEILNNINVPVDPSSTGLVGYWKLDENVGPTMYDSAGTQQNGTLSGGSIVSSDLTLPVELSSFTASLTAQYFVRLHWVTQSENDALGYRIYRSHDSDLEHALQVSPLINATNTTTQVSYEYTDSEVAPGTWYYWLQSLDLNGSYYFFGPVMATVVSDQGGEAPEIPVTTGISKIYPNPFNPSTTIKYVLADDLATSFRIYNTRGQLVQSYDFDMREPATYDLVWDASGLPAGIYLIRMQAGETVSMSKAVLSK